MSDDKRRNRRVGPPDKNAPGEKPKNLKTAIKKLISYLSGYKILILISIILSIFSSVLSIIGPDKLSDLTDEISNGLKINTTNLELINQSIETDLINNNISYEQIYSLSEEELYNIFSDFVVDGVEISSIDKIKFINIISSYSQEELYSAIDLMPTNIKLLLEPNMNIDNIKKIGFVLVLMYIISALFSYLENYLMVITSNNFAKRLRTKISKKINKLPLNYFDKNSYGDILSRVTNDVDTINMTLHNSLGTLVASIALFIGSLIMMFKTNYLMAICGILSSLLGFVLMALISKKSQKYFVSRQEELGKLNGHIEEIYSSHNIVKAYNGEKESLEKFENYNNSVCDANRKSQFLSGMMPPIMGFIGNLGYVVVCVVGALLVIEGKISFGVIVAFIMYVRLFTSPLSQIAQSVSQLQSAAAASERVFEFIEEDEMDNEEHLLGILDKNKASGNIEFNNVKFGYNKDKVIINDFSCKVKKGQKIAIVGPTGAGKTTLVNLLMKFYNIDDGEIKIDDISIKDLTRENIHDLFGSSRYLVI